MKVRIDVHMGGERGQGGCVELTRGRHRSDEMGVEAFVNVVFARRRVTFCRGAGGELFVGRMVFDDVIDELARGALAGLVEPHVRYHCRVVGAPDALYELWLLRARHQTRRRAAHQHQYVAHHVHCAERAQQLRLVARLLQLLLPCTLLLLVLLLMKKKRKI